MIKCPKCRGDTKVKKTKKHDYRTERKRLCLDCGHKFNTIEEIKEDKQE